MVHKANENSDKQVNKNKKEQEITMSQIIAKYFESTEDEKIYGTLKDKMDFFDDKNKDKSFDDFLSFVLKNFPEKHEEIKKNGIQNFNLERILQLNILSNNYKKLTTKIDNLFTNYNKSDLEKKLGKLSVEKIKNLNISETELKSFLIKEKIITNFETQSRKGINKIFDAIFAKKPEEIKKTDLELYNAVSAFISENKDVKSADINIILNKITKKEDKLNFLKYYQTTISLKDAFDFGIISKDEYNAHLTDLLKNSGIEESSITKSVLGGIDSSKILMDLEDDDFEKIISNSFEKNEKFFNFFAKEINSLKEKLEDTNVLNKSGFINHISKSEEINDKIKNEFKDKFVEGGFFRVDLGQEGIMYIKIKKFDNEKIELEEIHNSAGKVKYDYKIAENTKGKYDYSLLEKLLKYFSKKDRFKDFEYLTENEVESEEHLSTPLENITSRQDLERYLNEIDPEGVGIPLEDMTFFLDKDSDHFSKMDKKAKQKAFKNNPFGKMVYTIDKIQNGQIILNGGESFTFGEFAQVFKKHEFKRKPRIYGKKDFVDGILHADDIKSDLKANFKDIEYDSSSNKIIQKGGEKKKEIISFYTNSGDHKKENAYTLEINGDKTILKVGSYNNEKYTLEKSYKGDINYISHYLKGIINKKGLRPNTEYDFTEKKENNKKLKKRHWSILGKSYMNWFSLNDISEGGKLLFSTAKAELEGNTKLKSSKFAKRMGFLLPEEWAAALNQKVEGDMQELMEKTMKKLLKHSDKDHVIKFILETVRKSSAFDPELEGALCAVAEKFGTLYPGDLKDYERSFMWYKALGGKVGDESYTKAKDNALKGGAPFSELSAIEELIKSHEKQGLRRKNLRKKFSGYHIKGTSDAMESGKQKTDNSNYDSCIGMFVGNLDGREIPEAIGNIENLLSYTTSSNEINRIFFTFFGSGMLEKINLNQQRQMIKKSEGYIAPYGYISYILNSQKGTQKFKDIIKESLKELGHGNLISSFERAYNDPRKMDSFWKDNGKILDEILSMRNPLIFTKTDENPVFKEFYEDMIGWYGDKQINLDFKFIKEGHIDVKKGYKVGLTIPRLFGKFNTLNQSGNFSKEEDKIFDALLKEVDDIKNLKPSDIGIPSLEERLEIYKKSHPEASPSEIEGFTIKAKKEIDDELRAYQKKIYKYYYKSFYDNVGPKELLLRLISSGTAFSRLKKRGMDFSFLKDEDGKLRDISSNSKMFDVYFDEHFEHFMKNVVNYSDSFPRQVTSILNINNEIKESESSRAA